MFEEKCGRGCELVSGQFRICPVCESAICLNCQESSDSCPTCGTSFDEIEIVGGFISTRFETADDF